MLAKRRQTVCRLVPSTLSVAHVAVPVAIAAVRQLLCLPYLKPSRFEWILRQRCSDQSNSFFPNRAAQVLMHLGFARRSKTRSSRTRSLNMDHTSHVQLHLNPKPKNPYNVWLQDRRPATPWIFTVCLQSMPYLASAK